MPLEISNVRAKTQGEEQHILTKLILTEAGGPSDMLNLLQQQISFSPLRCYDTAAVSTHAQHLHIVYVFIYVAHVLRQTLLLDVSFRSSLLSHLALSQFALLNTYTCYFECIHVFPLTIMTKCSAL